jgi:hypothetical protein
MGQDLFPVWLRQSAVSSSLYTKTAIESMSSNVGLPLLVCDGQQMDNVGPSALGRDEERRGSGVGGGFVELLKDGVLESGGQAD